MHPATDRKVHPPLTPLLNALSVFYKGAAWLQRLLRARSSTDFPELYIVSVDNLAFGGTGKTPLIIALGEALQERRIRFAVISRGYASQYEKSGTRGSPEHGAMDIGDEAVLLKNHFPDADIFVGRNRKRSLSLARESGCRIAILDDGFQSAGIRKDFRIMLVDPDHPYYYLRHFRFLMRQTDCLLFHRHVPARYSASASGTYRFRIKEFLAPDGGSVDLGNRKIFAFSALADNQRFFADFAASNLAGCRGFPDHHRFTLADCRRLEGLRRDAGADVLVCSEKDFVKIRELPLAKAHFLYARNEVQLDIDIAGIIIRNAKEKGRL